MCVCVRFWSSLLDKTIIRIIRCFGVQIVSVVCPVDLSCTTGTVRAKSQEASGEITSPVFNIDLKRELFPFKSMALQTKPVVI